MKNAAGYGMQHVWLIGAGDGIGKALAHELARRGATLALSGRNADKLAALSGALGGGHVVLPFDVVDARAARAAADTLSSQWPRLDRAVFLAGQYQPMQLDRQDADMTRQIVETNLLGALNVTGAVLPWLYRQRGGQLALCGSIAGYSGLPKGQPYGATKAGIINLAESARLEGRKNGVDVRLISPGFVRTQLTDKNDFKMPALLEPADAARRIADGLLGRGFDINFPRRLSWPLKLLGALPRWLYFSLVRI